MNVEILVAGIGAVLIGLFALYLAVERDGTRAAEKTSEKALGTTVGAGGAAVAAATAGLEVVAQAPEIVITLLGIGSIMAGVSWEVFGATALTSYVVLAAVKGE